MTPSPSLSNESRIDLIDGFRCIAAMWVVAYHYYWGFDVANIGPEYPSWSFFRYGYFGVQLFFMISGFVIYRSLEQTRSAREFLAKRYLRLAPALILCSLITYVAMVWWNDSDRLNFWTPKTPLDFLFSFTFIRPEIWNTLLGRTEIDYMDGAYWSLWAEVVFYISASIVYFNSRKGNFLRNWFSLVLILNILRVVTSPKLAAFTPEFMLPVSNAYYRSFLFMNITFWAYFSTGILFYELWMKRSPSRSVWLMAAVLFPLEMYFIADDGIRVLFPVTIGLWIVFLLRPQWLGFLRWRPIQLIGLISYPLYLLHESAGLVLIEKLIKWTNHSVPGALVLTIVLGVSILLSYVVFTVFEKPVTRLLKGKLLGIK